jgi:hypothetical protein
MKLYSYSSELFKFIEVKWVKVKFIIGGILIVIIALFVIINLSSSASKVFGFSSTNTLASENSFLRNQVSLIAPQVSKLETRVKQLNEHADKYYILLHSRKIDKDTVSSLMNASKRQKHESLIYAAKSFLP